MRGEAQFAVCISNKGYAASLEVRKIYRLIPDRSGSKHGLVRVIDEMGEDYLFPEEYFVPLRLPQAAQLRILGAFGTFDFDPAYDYKAERRRSRSS